ncbi:MAG TPA: acyl-CoA dehydrogenase, partial [Alphaproteobacteria bacterium]|nr:acyl-CoA dehydrogenase [Alphaproteobacteria bacterium]
MTAMPSKTGQTAASDSPIARARDALHSAESLLAAAKSGVAAMVVRNGKIDRSLMEENQFPVHGLAWMATYVEALHEALGWAERLEDEGKFGRLEKLILQAGFGEYLAQLKGGIPMSQGEIIRPEALGLGAQDLAVFETGTVRSLIAEGTGTTLRAELAEVIEHTNSSGHFGDAGL